MKANSILAKLTIILLAVILTGVFAPLISYADSPVFSVTNTGIPGVGHSGVAWGDFNNDGKLDILVTGQNASFAGNSQIWQNLGAGVFSNLNLNLPGLSSSAVAVADFDNDSKPGFVITGFAGTDSNSFPVLASEVWRNLGNGIFTNLNVGLPGVDSGSVAWGDFDNDGKLDILLTGYNNTGAIAQIWRNLGNGVFSNLNVSLPGIFYGSVACIDFDNDGKLDILITGTTNGFVGGSISQVWRNLGNGVFSNINAGLPGIYDGSVAWADFDNDGRPDILLTGYGVSGPISQIWRNMGDGTFSNINAGLPGVYQSSAAWGDYDRDGYPDILLTGVDANTNLISQVWRNTGNGTFTNINAGLTGVAHGSAAWGDFDNDGMLDILLTGLDTNNNPVLNLYHNNTPNPSNAPPALFFAGEASLGNQVFYLAFTNGNIFGYYSLLNFPYVYHYDMGYEYFFDANNAAHGAYFYDFASGDFFYTEPGLFPYLYDFRLNAWLYYYPDTQSAGRYTKNPRYFFNFATGQIITR